MMKHVLLSIVTILLVCCNSGSDGYNKSKPKLSLFIMPEYKDNFIIKVDGSVYNNVIKNRGEHGPQELITTINKPLDSLKFDIQIMGKDTAFFYRMKGVDSLIFGLDISNRYFVVMTQDEYIWGYD